MITELDTASVGYPVTQLGVSFFPVYLKPNGLPEIATEGLIIEELEKETVPVLSVRNPTEKAILLIEGEHLVGGKQNRAVNATILVAPLSNLEIPVSCIERGRWGERRKYTKESSFTPQNVRSRLRETVNATMAREGSHRGYQRTIWGEVDGMLDRLDIKSATAAAADVEKVYKRDHTLSEAVEQLVGFGPLPRQNGIVVTHGTQVKALELFGSPDLLAKYWERLIRSHMLEVPRKPAHPSAAKALWGIRRFGSMDHMTRPGIGMGTELRMTDQVMVGQALALDKMIVHASMSTIA